MCGIISINQAKQQRERDEAELRSVREMTEQHQKAMIICMSESVNW